MPMSATLPNGSAPKATRNRPQTIQDLASDQLRVSGALAVADRIKDKRYLEAITNAEAKSVYGDAFKLDEEEPMVAIDSKFETHHHAAPLTPPAVQTSRSLPAWIAGALAAASVVGAGAGGMWFAKPNPAGETVAAPSPATAPVVADKSKSYQLDFW
jgi:hypothetical protein